MEEGFPSIDIPDFVAAAPDNPGSRKYRTDDAAVDDQLQASSVPVDKHRHQKVRQGSFPYLGLRPEVCSALSRKGYGFPTPIQRRVIPAVLAGRDVVAMARTGSGKTAAFLTPVLHRLAAKPRSVAVSARRNGPRALILTPTRELALQTLRFHKAYGRGLEPKIGATVVVGGTPLEAQFEALAICPDVLVATPGRLLQMLAEMGTTNGLTLSSVEIFVMDEADRLFEGTLAAETAAVLDQLCPDNQVNAERQTVLVSATMPSALAAFTRCSLRRNVEVIRLDVDKTISPTLANAFVVTRGGDEKIATLVAILRSILSSDEQRSVVVFAATHRTVEYLVPLLQLMLSSGPRMSNDAIACIHGNMDQGARVEAVAAFRKRQTRVLVVTDVAARGIDLPELDIVVNFDMAPVPKLFIHRVGRVGRAGRPGFAVSLISADETPYMLDTLLFLGRGISLSTEQLHKQVPFAAGQDVWTQHSKAMDTSFIIGGLPNNYVEDDVEMLNKILQSNGEVEKLRRSACNANSLYMKTRSRASGQSVRRSKDLYTDEKGGFRSIPVHPWFQNLEDEVDRQVREQVVRLSSWRPRETGMQESEAMAARRQKLIANEIGDHLSDSNGESFDGSLFDEKCNARRIDSAKRASKPKRSSRQALLEEQKLRFYMPLSKSDADQREDNFSVIQGTLIPQDDDGLRAFRAVQAATMDVAADTNPDLLREKHQGPKNGMFWDRVSKKFVKGGASGRISKQNVHVATREAKMRARGAQVSSYGTEDGAKYKVWLSKNKKVIDRIRESGAECGMHHGLGNSDMRRGAYGRKARIAAMSTRKAAGDNPAKTRSSSDAAPTFRSVRSEIKSPAEIKKQRKLRKKAEARRISKSKNSGRRTAGPVLPRPEKRRSGAPRRSKVFVRR